MYNLNNSSLQELLFSRQMLRFLKDDDTIPAYLFSSFTTNTDYNLGYVEHGSVDSASYDNVGTATIDNLQFAVIKGIDNDRPAEFSRYAVTKGNAATVDECISTQ